MEIKTESGFIDLYDGFDYSFNYNISDVRDVNSRKANYSKTIKIPSTRNNNRIFEFAFDVNVQSVNFDSTKKLPCEVMHEGQIVFTGDIQLTSVNIVDQKKEYEILIFSKIRSFIDSINDITLDQLDFSKYNHSLNLENVENSTNNTVKVYGNDSSTSGKSIGYIYPYIDYGYERSSQGLMKVQHLRPAIYIKEYFDKLMELSGLSYTSYFLNTDYFKKIILPFTNGNLEYTEEEKDNREITLFDSVYTLSTIPQGIIFNNNYFFNDLNLTETKDNLNQFSGNVFTPNAEGSYNVNFTSEIEFEYNNTSGETAYKDINGIQKVELYILNNTDNLTIHTEELLLEAPTQTEILDGESYTQTYSIGSSININFEAGKNYEFEIRVENSSYYWIQPFVFTKETIECNHELKDASLKINAEDSTNIGYNSEYTLSQAIPQIKAREFIKSLITTFNLYIYENPDVKNNVIIETRDEFYNNGKIHDWSKKIDYSKEQNIVNSSTLSSRFYEFNFKDGKDKANKEYKNKFNETLGNNTIEIPNDFKSDTNTKTVLFSSSDTETQTINFNNGVDDILIGSDVPVFYQQDDINDSSTKKNTKLNPRLLFLTNKNNYWFDTFVETGDLYTELELYNSDIYDNREYPQFSLYFGDTQTGLNPYFNLYNLFHKNSIEELAEKNNKVYTAYFLLDNIDISKLNLRDKIFCNGNYYYINKITDYNPEVKQSIKVELIKLKGNVNYLSAENIIKEIEEDNQLFSDNFSNNFA